MIGYGIGMYKHTYGVINTGIAEPEPEPEPELGIGISGMFSVRLGAGMWDILRVLWVWGISVDAEGGRSLTY